MGTFGRTWEALGVQSGALGAFVGIQVSSGILDRLFESNFEVTCACSAESGGMRAASGGGGGFASELARTL